MRKMKEHHKLIVLFFSIILCNMFVFRMAIVFGESMEPTLNANDWVLVWQLFYNPFPGDIVITDKSNEYSQNLVKRVIAVENQHLVLCDNQVFVDDVLIEEDYLLEKNTCDYSTVDMVIPEGEVFVMGDNRGGSKDSRDFGCIPVEQVKGKVLIRLFPLNKICLLH